MLGIVAAPDPRMRAAITQILLGGVERLPPVEREAITGRLGEADMRAIREALPVGWCPMDLHMRLSDAIRDTVGSARNLELWTATMSALFERPLLRGFVQTTTGLFGLKPGTFLRHVEKFELQIARDVGKLEGTVEPSGGAGEVSLRGFPSSRFNFACYAEGLQGCITAILPLCHVRGRVTVAHQDDARGDVRYRVEWEGGGR
jgi:hypothetical protein